MPQTKQIKSELIDELKKLFDKASILVFVNFHGLSVAKERKLRKVFRQSETKYVADDVIKRLAAIASREVLLTQLAFILSQPVAGFARALDAVSKKSSF